MLLVNKILLKPIYDTHCAFVYLDDPVQLLLYLLHHTHGAQVTHVAGHLEAVRGRLEVLLLEHAGSAHPLAHHVDEAQRQHAERPQRPVADGVRRMQVQVGEDGLCQRVTLQPRHLGHRYDTIEAQRTLHRQLHYEITPTITL